ncbi:hypothetical protein WA538_003475 [Blastocystis sp. DL]
MESKPKRIIGLVGGICSGKSTVSAILKDCGCFCLDCDKLGHRVYEPNTDGFRRIVETFGKEVVGEDGTINRRVLGSIVFSDPEKMKQLTAISWPLIHDMAREEIEKCHESIIVVEAAVLLEAKWNDLVDEVLLFAVNYS